MIATSHVIIGGAVGVATGSPAAAFAAGIVSHLLCDCIPHLDTPPDTKYIGDDAIWDRKLYAFALTDTFLAFFVTLFIWIFEFDFIFFSPYAWGALGAFLPDFIDNVPFWGKYFQRLPGFNKFHEVHLGVHKLWRGKYPMPKHWKLGTITQIITVGLALMYLF